MENGPPNVPRDRFDFPNPPLWFSGYFWIRPTDRSRLCHLVKGKMPAPESPGTALETLCGVTNLPGKAYEKVHASTACATCVDRASAARGDAWT